MTERIRVVIVDDHAVVRRGLRAFLDLQPDIEVVGEAADGVSAEDVCGMLRPDVVLMDLVMPGTDGIGTIRRLRQALPGSAVLVLTSYLDDVHVFAALEAGAAGYLLKDVQPDELVRGIRQVRLGEPAIHPRWPPGSSSTQRNQRPLPISRLANETFYGCWPKASQIRRSPAASRSPKRPSRPMSAISCRSWELPIAPRPPCSRCGAGWSSSSA